MKAILSVGFALVLSACSYTGHPDFLGGLTTSQPVYARTLYDRTTVGGPNYPIVISGADQVGLTPVDLAQRLRFPNGFGYFGGSTFHAIDGSGPEPDNHAHLNVTPDGSRIKSTMTFYHGDRKIGLGSFSLPREAYANPYVVADVSATLMIDLMRMAKAQFRDYDRHIWRRH